MPACAVAFFLQSLEGGGAERNLLRLAGGLAERGHDVTIVTTGAHANLGARVPSGVVVHDLSVRFFPTAFLPLARYLRRHRPDVLVSALSAANTMSIVARRIARVDTAVVVTERNNPIAQRADARTLRRRFVTPWLMRRLYPHASAIVGVSEGVAQDLAAFVGLDVDRIVAIPNPVVDDELAALAAEPLTDDWLQTIGGRRLVVNVGRLERHKDHELLLQAFARVHTRIPGTVLAIVGEGPERLAIEALIGDLGLDDAVLLTGFQDNPYPWMAHAEVFVLASRYEGLPTVLIEALTCGARVVSTDCPSGPDEILEHGRWGRLVEIGDTEALATAISDALADGRWVHPPTEALKPYRPATVIDRYEELMSATVARR